MKTLRIMAELTQQQEIEGHTENIKILRRFLGCILYEKQWEAFVETKLIPHTSYCFSKMYYAKPELIKLLSPTTREKIRNEKADKMAEKDS